MILFKTDEAFDWPVTVSLPRDGDHVDQTFTGQFLLIPDAEFYEEIDASKMSEHIDAEISRLLRVFVGWEDGAIKVPGEDGTPVDMAPTDENRRTLLSMRAFRLGVAEAYREASSPRQGARVKNSARPHG